MKAIGAVGLAILFGACSFAQYRNFGHVGAPQSVSNTYGSNTGFGRVLFPGTGHPPGLGTGSSFPNSYGSGTGFGRVLFPGTGHPPSVGNPLSITDPTFASRLGATVGGFGANGGHGYRRFRQSTVIPYAVPVYVGGYSGGYPDSGYADQQPMMPPQQAPEVIINQGFMPERAEPVMREYREDSSGGLHVYEAPGRQPVETAEEENIDYYLIAFRDHSIYSAFAYWVESDTLHYVTPQRVHNQVSLSLVDRELTDKLNRDRQLQVKLPK